VALQSRGRPSKSLQPTALSGVEIAACSGFVGRFVVR